MEKVHDLSGDTEDLFRFLEDLSAPLLVFIVLYGLCGVILYSTAPH